ncbi:protein-glutamate O-methyltransferase CheR [Conexibacter sp. SYSU D00693]|uniref:CheR family methyltransferase n=1 Tax=Conexibacter sp. SYSU D00693 TaxID=2812560 RepID=UPI00196B3B9A|nr:protein-glutamate O-methyltransferase CheR [Conexibacter sp. SYSU D00693]
MSALAGGRADDYVDLCTAVRSINGIDLSQYKRDQMERRIRSFAGARGVQDLREYAKTLRADKDELEAFLDRVTINVSQLWRNPEQWEALAKTVLPELAASGGGRIRAWSAGCSYGAEAHTLAAVCLDAVPAARVSILGTDIDARMVARAKAGLFSKEDGRDAPADALRRHFDAVDSGLQAKDAVRRLCRFEQGDLLRLKPVPGSQDLVLCRNTVIYFTPEVRDDLHARLASALRPGGRMVVGATERVNEPAAMGLVPEAPFLYRREA